ncbi:hypothetical protein HY374_00175 [Candidatus Berkelbacteria bacterium]|nr:hypothetical protein [Candidatus Berkelbacteria bacterium]
MKPWQAALLALIIVEVQVNVLAVWPVLGGVPNLIALGSVPMALLSDFRSGLVWVLIGASLLDLLIPVRFGTTLIPLLVIYGLIRVLARHVVNTPTWWSVTGLALLAVGGTELPLALLVGNWPQYGRDLVAATLIAIPLGVIVAQAVTARHSGLWIRS